MTNIRNNSKSRSGLFLLELIIVIVFFALSSVICVQLFVKAHTLSQRSGDLNMAVLQAQNAAEAFKASGGDADGFSSLSGVQGPVNNSNTSDIYTQYFDSGWQPVDYTNEAAFMLNVEIFQENSLKTAEIRVIRLGSDEEIYGVTAKSCAGLEALT